MKKCRCYADHDERSGEKEQKRDENVSLPIEGEELCFRELPGDLICSQKAVSKQERWRASRDLGNVFFSRSVVVVG